MGGRTFKAKLKEHGVELVEGAQKAGTDDGRFFILPHDNETKEQIIQKMANKTEQPEQTEAVNQPEEQPQKPSKPTKKTTRARKTKKTEAKAVAPEYYEVRFITPNGGTIIVKALRACKSYNDLIFMLAYPPDSELRYEPPMLGEADVPLLDIVVIKHEAGRALQPAEFNQMMYVGKIGIDDLDYLIFLNLQHLAGGNENETWPVESGTITL